MKSTPSSLALLAMQRQGQRQSDLKANRGFKEHKEREGQRATQEL
jgi:hypothetical protein